MKTRPELHMTRRRAATASDPCTHTWQQRAIGRLRHVMSGAEGVRAWPSGLRGAAAGRAGRQLFEVCRGSLLSSHMISPLLLRVCSHNRPGPVKSVTRPSPLSMVVFQPPALRTR